MSAVSKRLRLAVAAVVLLPVAGAGYEIMSTPPMYLESAIVEFSLPKSQAAPDAYYLFAPSLITTGEVITQLLTGAEAQHQIRESGGTASVSLALVNLYNEQYPEYSYPLATLTASSPSPARSRHGFTIAARLLEQTLAARQAQAGVAPRNRISARIIGDTGPVVQPGSPTRETAGLALLAVMAVSLAWGLPDWRTARMAPGRRPEQR
jgi:hypothetical protein